MWEPRCLTTLWASTACGRGKFRLTFLLTLIDGSLGFFNDVATTSTWQEYFQWWASKHFEEGRRQSYDAKAGTVIFLGLCSIQLGVFRIVVWKFLLPTLDSRKVDECPLAAIHFRWASWSGGKRSCFVFRGSRIQVYTCWHSSFSPVPSRKWNRTAPFLYNPLF
jgi:hypothetical protein